MAQQLGYLIIWRIADLAAPYADLVALARQVGFPAACLPKPPGAYSAWQKATNLRKQKLIPPASLVEEIEAEFGCKPIVQAESKIISQTVRHIVRSVTIGTARSKNAQFDAEPVAILKFDQYGLTNEEKFIGLYPHDDPLEAVNGNVDCLIHRMKLEYHRQLTMADGQEVRAGIRDFLAGLDAICLADGTYFVLNGLEGKLAALQGYITGLARWKRSESTLTCQVYPVLSSTSSDDRTPVDEQNRAEIMAGVVGHFKPILKRILADVSGRDGRGDRATQMRLERAGADLEKVSAAVRVYQEALGELGLGDLVGRCERTVKEAKKAAQ